MTTYGHRKSDDLHCKYGCCTLTKTASKFSRHRGLPRDSRNDHSAKSRARQAGRRATRDGII